MSTVYGGEKSLNVSNATYRQSSVGRFKKSFVGRIKQIIVEVITKPRSASEMIRKLKHDFKNQAQNIRYFDFFSKRT